MQCNSYLISLDYPTEKMEYLQCYDVEPIFVKGINGKNTDNKSFIPDSTYGCALSHQLVWKTFLESDDEYAVVFEDDVILEPNFVETVNMILEQNYSLDIILLGELRFGNLEKKIDSLLGIYNLGFGTHAYLINREGAMNLLENTKDLWTHLDLHINILYSQGKITKGSLMDRIAYQTSTTGISSQTKDTPLILNKIFSMIEVDKMVSLKYLTSVNFIKLFNQNININCLLIMIIGFIVGKKYNLLESIGIFVILYSMDLYHNIPAHEFIFHLMLFLIVRIV